MTSISQIIPNYSVGGISDQPDELKKPGQLRDCLNAYPDLVYGLYRRPGFELLGPLPDNCTVNDIANQGGTWFPFIRQNLTSKTQENFLFFVSRSTGRLHAWDENAEPCEVFYNRKPLTSSQINKGDINVTDNDLCLSENYLKHNDNDVLRAVTINNYTVLTNPEIPVSMNRNRNERPYEAFIEVTQLAYAREYLLGVDIIDDPGTSSYKVASRVNIVEVDNSRTDDNKEPSCPGTYREIVTLDKSFLVGSAGGRDPADLVVEIETTGVQTQGSKRLYCTYNHRVSIVNGGRDWRKGDQVRIYQSGGSTPADDNDIGYLIEIDEVDTIFSPSQNPITGVLTPSTGDTQTTIGAVLQDMRAAIADQSPISINDIEIVGSGLYITHPKPFTVTTSETDLMNILTNTEEIEENPYVVVNNVSRLPIECKNGVIAKVSNAFSDDDDYWVQFKSSHGEADNNTPAASGYWEEVAEPGGEVTFNSSSMPHVIIFARNNGKPAFIVSAVKWNERTCGSEELNPSFVDNPITNVLFYRNRLTFLSQENVIMSKAGDLFNFFPTSAIGVSADDPIDISVSTSFSSVLQDGIVINNGMVLFSKYQQFLLNTSNDILSPNTAKISEISRYEFETTSRPFALGTNIGFVGPSAQTSAFYELTNVFNEGPVDVIERSKIVSRSIPQKINLIAESKETGVVFFGTFLSNEIWGFRYFKEGNQNEVQSTWFRWTLPYPLVNHYIIDGTYYAIVDRSGGSTFLRLKLDSLPTQGPFRDLWSDDPDFAEFARPYTTKIEFPTINVLKAEQQSYRADTTASLVVHRMNFNFADVGTYQFNIDRNNYKTGIDDYEILYESRPMDDYEADEDPLVSEVERIVPVYTRNTNLNVELETFYEHPMILRSMRWEGDYNPRYYKRV